MKPIKFLSHFLDNKQVGAVMPSSRFLVKEMIRPIDFSKAKLIVEFGPGPGNITKEILKKMLPDAKLIVFEINENFLEELKKIKDKRMHLYSVGAEKAADILIENNFGVADYVVSSLPLAIIPNNTVTRILSKSYSFLKKGNTYIQFQYSPTSLTRLKRIFDKVDVRFVPINVPPALVYVCWKN